MMQGIHGKVRRSLHDLIRAYRTKFTPFCQRMTVLDLKLDDGHACPFAYNLCVEMPNLDEPNQHIKLIYENKDPADDIELRRHKPEHWIRHVTEGGASCLLDALSFGEGGEQFRHHIQTAFAYWIEAFAALVIEHTGCSEAEAQLRAEDAILSIQGALVFARGTDKTEPFQRVLKNLPTLLLNART